MSVNNESDAVSPMQASLRRLPYFVRELAAGGVAGGLAKTCCAPLERTKILLQTGRSGASIPDTLAYMWRTEGIKGLFKGNIASVLRIVPYAAVHFSLYEQYRRWLLDTLAGPGQGAAAAGGHVHPVWDLLAGSLSGATAVMATYPLDLVRTRLAYVTEAKTTTAAPRASSSSAGSAGSTASAAASSSNTNKVTIRSVIARTLQQEGVTGLYKGITPTLLGILPYAGIKFYVYQSLKAYYRTSQQQATATAAATATATAQEAATSAAAGSTAGSASAGSAAAGKAADSSSSNSSSSGNKRERLPVPMMLLFGGASGLVAQTLTYPLDLVRRRMQVYSLLGPLEQQHHVHAAPHPHAAQQHRGTHIPHHLSVPQHGAAAAAGTTSRSLHQAPGSGSPSSTRARAPNTWQTFRELWGRGGLRALYKGLSINYIKVVPSTAIGFTIYDALKAYLDLRGNI